MELETICFRALRKSNDTLSHTDVVKLINLCCLNSKRVGANSNKDGLLNREFFIRKTSHNINKTTLFRFFNVSGYSKVFYICMKTQHRLDLCSTYIYIIYTTFN